MDWEHPDADPVADIRAHAARLRRQPPQPIHPLELRELLIREYLMATDEVETPKCPTCGKGYVECFCKLPPPQPRYDPRTRADEPPR